MKQFNRGINAYKSASTGTLINLENVDEKPIISNQKIDGLIKTTQDKTKENKYVKVAKLLIVLGRDEASKVISHLSPIEIESISKEIAKIDRVEKAEAISLLNEFGKNRNLLDRAQGGIEVARSILVNTFGQEKGNKILYKAVPDSADIPFAFLNDLDFKQRMLLLRKESISVLTIILHYLSPKIASPILESLTPEQQNEIVKRISKLKRVSPEVISIISENLKDKIVQLGTPNDIEIDGRGALVDILKHMNREDEKNILLDIDRGDPSLGEVIRNRLYSIDIINSINPVDFQKIIQEFSDNDLVYLIKGESVEIQNKIWESMSLGRRALVEAEMEVVGMIKKSDADKMTKSFIELIHRKEENGELRMITEDDLIY